VHATRAVDLSFITERERARHELKLATATFQFNDSGCAVIDFLTLCGSHVITGRGSDARATLASECTYDADWARYEEREGLYIATKLKHDTQVLGNFGGLQ
jgi:hypothetical protein